MNKILKVLLVVFALVAFFPVLNGSRVYATHDGSGNCNPAGLKGSVCQDPDCQIVSVPSPGGTVYTCAPKSGKLPGGVFPINPTPKPGPISGPTACKGGTGINTAIGCIPVDSSNNFVAWFLRWSIGIAGGIAFLMIVFASFQVMTASGDPQKLQGGRELLTAAISGLILIIFSIFLLRLIGVTILDIPGL